MERPVITGVDTSPDSLAAADWAAREALRRELPLRIVYVVERPMPRVVGVPQPDVQPMPPDSVLEGAVAMVQGRYPSLRISGERIEDHPASALVEAASHAELLGLGSRGLGAVSGFLVGSVALAVLARAERPVVLVRGGELAESERVLEAAVVPLPWAQPREVLLGLDLGHPCEQVTEFAFTAAACRKAPLRVIHAWEPPAPAEQGGRAALVSEQQREGLAMSGALLPWREKFPGVAVTEQLAMGHPARYLVEAASLAGMLVIGRWTERPAAGTRIGPVGHALLHHACCPVAVVPHN